MSTNFMTIDKNNTKLCLLSILPFIYSKEIFYFKLKYLRPFIHSPSHLSSLLVRSLSLSLSSPSISFMCSLYTVIWLISLRLASVSLMGLDSISLQYVSSLYSLKTSLRLGSVFARFDFTRSFLSFCSVLSN